MQREKNQFTIISILKNIALPVVLAIISAEIHRRMTQSGFLDSFIFLIISFAGFLAIDHIYRARIVPLFHRNKNTYSASVVVFDKSLQKVLLEKRPLTKRLYSGMYCLPGGHVKVNEEIEDTAKRELYEETKLTVNDLYYVRSYHDHDHAITMFIYCLRYENGQSYKSYNWFQLTDIHKIESELAPNIKDAIFRSRTYLETYGLIGKLDNIIEKSSSNVLENIKKIDGKSGWDQYLYIEGVGIIGASIGLLILADRILPYKNKKIESVQDTLIKEVNNDGGWGTRSTKLASKSKGCFLSIVESTAFALLGLMKSGIDKNNEIIRRGIKWLNDNAFENGSFGVNKHTKSRRVFSTCLALLALDEYGNSDDLIDKGIDWLGSVQLENGGWPHGNIYRSSIDKKNDNIATSSLALYTLFELGKLESDHHIIRNAITYLDGAISDSSKINDSSEIDFATDENASRQYRIEVKYDTNALLLLAISKIKNNYSDFEHDLVRKIVANYNIDTNWSHSMTPGRHPIWATYFNNLALQEVRRKLANQTILN